MISHTNKLAICSMAVALVATSASAQTVVSESFGGLNSDPLNGTTADTFSSAITTAGGSSTWSAPTAGWNADGTMTGNNGSAFLNLGSFINGAKGQADGVFTLSATVTVTGGSWGSLGFLDSPTTGSNFTTTGEGTWLYRDGGDLDIFGEDGSSNSVEGPNVTAGSSQLLTLVLDLSDHDGTTNFGSVAFYLGTAESGSLEHTFEYTSDRSFTAIGMTATGTPQGSYSDLTLTQVPEPSAFALLAGCFGLTWVMLRRRG